MLTVDKSFHVTLLSSEYIQVPIVASAATIAHPCAFEISTSPNVYEFNIVSSATGSCVLGITSSLIIYAPVSVGASFTPVTVIVAEAVPVLKYTDAAYVKVCPAVPTPPETGFHARKEIDVLPL